MSNRSVFLTPSFPPEREEEEGGRLDKKMNGKENYLDKSLEKL